MEILNFNLNLVLHPNQRIVHDCPAKFKVIRAGKQFGKTKCVLFDLCQVAAKTPNGTFWYIAPTYGMAKSIAWFELRWLLPDKLCRRNETELYVEFKSGSRIYLKGADHEDSLRGVALNGVVYDEAAYIKDYVHEGIIASQLLAKDGFAWWISTPHKDGRNWFSTLWDDAKRRSDSGDRNWAAFYYTTYDNPTIPKERIDAMKETMSDEKFSLEILAQEQLFSGQKFHEFDTAKNIGEYAGDRVLPVYRFHDQGISQQHPAVCLWAKADLNNGKVYIYDELVARGQILQQIVQTIKEKTGDTPIEFDVGDPSASQTDKVTGRSAMDEYHRLGIGYIPGDRRERGYDIVKMFLKTGRLVISPKCRNLIYELRNLQWVDKLGDDATDALRYGLVRMHDTIHALNVTDFSEPEVKLKPNTWNIHYFEQTKTDNRTWAQEVASVA